MIPNKLNICFFGTYDRNYSRNKIILTGLLRNGYTPIEVHTQLTQMELYSKKHLSILAIGYRLFRKLKFIPIVIKNISKIKTADIIFMPYPGHLELPLGYILAKLFRKPLVFDPICCFYQVLISDFGIVKPNSFLSKVVKITEQLLFRLPDLILADSNFQKEYYIKELSLEESKVQSVPLGADDQIYKFAPKKADGYFNVVYYGLYNPIHGVEYIVEAAKLCQNDKNIRFLMIGNGQTFEENYQKAKDLNLKNMIFYKDMTEKNAFSTLKQADIFLGFLQNSPTVFRAIPNKVFQGIAMGKVVVTADTLVIRSVFTDRENIYLCQAANAKNLSQAILELKKDPLLQKQIAKKAYKLYKNNLTPGMIANQFLKIMETMVQKEGHINH